jgi:hypothetical protein
VNEWINLKKIEEYMKDGMKEGMNKLKRNE